MGQTALIPAWVAPAPRAVEDCHWIAASTSPRVAAVLDWVTGDLPTEQQAFDRLGVESGAAEDALAWLLGIVRIPPVELPRRQADGTIVTVEQLVAEHLAGTFGLPEQRRAAETKARSAVAGYRRLAGMVPH